MNTKRTEVGSKRKASSAEEEEPPCKKTNLTEDIPSHVKEQMSNHLILETLFSHLSPRDMKTAALVCRTWRQVVETPRYWTWATVRINKDNFQERISANRTSFVKVENDVEPELTNDQLRILCKDIVETEKFKMKKLRISSGAISADLYSLLLEAVVKLEEAELYVELSEEQLRQIFRKIAEVEDHQLKSLTYFPLESAGMSSVPAEVFSEAAVRLESIESRMLSGEQLNALSRKITETEDLTLKELVIEQVEENLTLVQVEMFSKAAVRLESVDCSWMGPDHLEALFRKIAVTEDYILKKIYNLDYLSSVPADILPQDD